MTTGKLIALSQNEFYTTQPYPGTTAREFAEKKTLSPSYPFNTQNKIERIALLLFSVIVFPIGLCRLLHRLIGKVFITASSPWLQKCVVEGSLIPPHQARQRIHFKKDFGYKRICVECNGYKIDTMILIGRGAIRRRWVLFSNGNGEFYENLLTQNLNVKEFLNSIQANAVFFNYPGVGASSGLPSKSAMVDAYKAILTMLEDNKEGLGAKEIIGYGSSFIGSGVQGEALCTHKLKGDIKYVFIKDRGASSVSKIASCKAHIPIGFLVKLFGWDFDCTASSRKLTKPEIIIQTAHVGTPQKLISPKKLCHDDCIPQNATLAHHILSKDQQGTKIVFGVPEKHNDPFGDTSFLVKEIDRLLPLI